ncbi:MULTISPECIES: DUF1842 domain-containing protein [Burkholderia]|uniref:DUF1842 domain-containing protein n=2 Tax=Burkholderia humptydooensis TaxID=430531 RepID=A0A7U4P8K7_9BURK|nr:MULTISPECIES: DUF1842 domain-containing protein [Burkholderia]AGK51586.1 hypothetical protein BTI_4516 [Burkholderia thailandensis MSMB121]ATF33965.1 hypothetical protein CO709_12250 [Burkholderia thailandensis]AJY40089.1 hypothetical protein BW21_4039 [Burkholderia sp. 2002721687]ALX44958.1 hypothetical protein AQ610_20710 [Burkholderia humptydooensis]EIP85227.1 hypothetical protein A33K_18177 [Burkholderia humptydooensis MSMB43]
MATTGLFPVQLRVATPNLGAPVLWLYLLVNAVEKTVSGFARITQPIYPPPHFRARVVGQFHQVRIDPLAPPSIALTLTGSPTGPIAPQVVILELNGLLNDDWQSGTANYRYFYEGRWHSIEHAIVSKDNSLIPLDPPHEHVVPMYGVGLQEARASGDLSRMKAIAQQAEQQLADHDAIAAELETLEAEIARLEARR